MGIAEVHQSDLKLTFLLCTSLVGPNLNGIVSYSPPLPSVVESSLTVALSSFSSDASRDPSSLTRTPRPTRRLPFTGESRRGEELVAAVY